MSKIQAKQKQLLELLLINHDFKPVSYYADVLHVSSRSIHNYISNLHSYLESMNLNVQTKPGTGIRLIGDATNKLEALQLVYRQKRKIENLSTEDRQYQIMKMLVLEQKVVTHKMLAEMFYVSTTSISKDLMKISSLFDPHTVQLKATKKGTKIVGSEVQIQNTMIKYMNSILQEAHVYEEEIGTCESIAFLTDYFDKEVVETVYQNIKIIQETFPIFIPDKYQCSLLVMLVVLLSRLRKDKHPILNRNFIFEEIHNLDTYVIAEQLLKDCAKSLVFIYQESDIDYLNKQLIGHSVQLRYHEQAENTQYRAIVKQLMKVMGEILEVDLTNDQTLYENVIVHFGPMIYRRKMNITIKNPLLREIKEQYSIVFSGMWYAMSNIETILNIQMNDDEISFLAVHFQIAVERNTNGKKILIVCPNGVGISELIYNKVQKIIPSQDTIEVTTIKQLYNRDLHHIDLIISPIDVDVEKIPTVKISVLVTNTDIKNITNIYADLFYTEVKEELVDTQYTFTKLGTLIDTKYIFTNMNVSSREECLHFLTDTLIQDKIVDKEFKNSVFSREQLGETDLVSGVALPHASPEHVSESKIAIMTLQYPILWQKQKISVVLLLCLSKQDSQEVKSILSEVYTVVNSKEHVQYYFNHKNKQEIVALLT